MSPTTFSSDTNLTTFSDDASLTIFGGDISPTTFSGDVDNRNVEYLFMRSMVDL